jgi:pilus assembly protein CpaF
MTIDALLEEVRDRPQLADLDVAARRLALRDLVHELSPGADAADLVARLSDEIDGLGILEPLMRDPDVTDVLVTGTDPVWVERAGRLEPTGVRFERAGDLAALVERVVGTAGGRIDRARPIADVRLRDGSRLHAVLPPVAPAGPVVSIRRFPRSRPSLADLVRMGMATEGQAARLTELVAARKSIAVGGGTGAGKTTLVNALLGCVPADERVVIVEELPELAPSCAHLVSLVARPANHEGAGAIDLEELVRASLRMRPDRVVVGEVRGAEARAALDAFSTGHEGSLLTVHARSARHVARRLASLASRAPGEVRTAAQLGAEFDAALDAIVYVERTRKGRRIVELGERPDDA